MYLPTVKTTSTRDFLAATQRPTTQQTRMMKATKRQAQLLAPSSMSKLVDELDGNNLNSTQLQDQMRLHLATDAGKELTKKVPKNVGVDEEIYVVDHKKGENLLHGVAGFSDQLW